MAKLIIYVKDMTRLIITGFFLLILVIPLSGQELAAFEDNQNRFYIFDDGVITQVEYLPVKSFKVGGNCVLYVDNMDHLKMYYNGEISTLEVNRVDQYHALDYLAGYSFSGVVKIIENGVVSTITTNAMQYYPEDSLVVFYDRSRSLLAVYYKGNIEILEDELAGKSYSGLLCGDNLIIYVSDVANDLKAFYLGETIILEPSFLGNHYKPGKDIIAYISDSDQKFKVFYQGEIYILEDFPPVSYQPGDGIVSYTDHNGTFKVFSGGDKYEISGSMPDFYQVRNRMIIYGEQGYFKTWHNGQVYTLENYIPADWEADWNSIVYWDVNRNLKVFSNGENKILTYDLIRDIQLYRDVIVVNKGMNNCNVYYKGDKY